MKIILSTFIIVTLLFLSSCKDKNEKSTELDKPVTAAENQVAIEVAESKISIGELFTNRDSYNGKVVIVSGEVTKINKAIMGRNWVHLKDGTGGPGTDDLLITTQENVTTGNVVTFSGMVVLKKDFGSGYYYELLLEMGKIVH